MSETKTVGLSAGVTIAISMVIGSGLFGLPGVAIKASGPWNALIGWLIVIAIMPMMIHIFVSFGKKYPNSSGISFYASRALGSWSESGILFLTVGTLAVGMPAFFLVGGSYAASLFGLNEDQWSTWFAIGIAAISTVINIRGTQNLAWFNHFAVIFILFLIAFIFIRSWSNITYAAQDIYVDNSINWSFDSIWAAASIVFWAFQGWENLTFGSSDIDSPSRNVPRIFWYSFLIVSLLYALFALSVSVSAFYGLNVSKLNGLVAFLPSGVAGHVILFLMVLILLSNANSWVFGASRAFRSAANKKLLPSIIAKDSTRGMPVGSLVCSFFFYTLIICAVHYFGIDPKYIFLITTQGFIILYGGSIFGFAREFRGIRSIFVFFAALLGWLFLMQGFGLFLIYPAACFIIGIAISNISNGRLRSIHSG